MAKISVYSVAQFLGGFLASGMMYINYINAINSYEVRHSAKPTVRFLTLLMSSWDKTFVLCLHLKRLLVSGQDQPADAVVGWNMQKPECSAHILITHVRDLRSQGRTRIVEPWGERGPVPSSPSPSSSSSVAWEHALDGRPATPSIWVATLVLG